MVDSDFDQATEAPTKVCSRAPSKPEVGSATLGSAETFSARNVERALREAKGWLSKSDIIKSSGIEPARWNAVIKELLAQGVVIRQGERRGAKYRIFECN